MDSILKILLQGTGSPLLPVLLLFLFFFWWFDKPIDKEASRKQLIQRFRDHRWSKAYETCVRGFLDRGDKILAPDPIAQGREPTHPFHAWHPQVFNISLFLAMVYPILMILALWVWTGEAGHIGAVTVLEEQRNVWLRWIVFGVIGVEIAALIYLATIRREVSSFAFFVAVAFVFVCAVVFAFAYALDFAYAFGYALAGAGVVIVLGVVFIAVADVFDVAGAVAGAVSGVGVFDVDVAGAGARARVVAGAIPIALAFALAFALTGFFAFALVGAGAGAIPITLAFAFAFIFLNILGKKSARLFNIALLALPGLYLTLFLIVLILLKDAASLSERSLSFILFLVLLPFVNALFDYFSLGMTRLCMRFGLTPKKPLETKEFPALAACFNVLKRFKALLWSLVDLVYALAFFILLGCAAILLFHHTSLSDEKPLLDLSDLFKDLYKNPHAYWWLYFTFFSTLLPTIVHACIALFSLATHTPRWLSACIVRQLRNVDKDDGFAYSRARAAVAGVYTFAYAAPVVVILIAGAGLWSLRADIGLALYGVFAAFARWIGAL